jgi:glucose-6-phosphate dehydrogenase assembly protein OpcA
MSTPQQPMLLDQPREVDITAIERELTQLWKQGVDRDDGQASAPLVRACSMNFIVFAEDVSRANDIANMVGEVTLEHPSRIFLILADRRSAQPLLDSWISARCSVPVPGGKQVCCEQINLTAQGTEANKVPSIVTSLLVPDVPAILLWKTNVDVNDRVMHSLIDISDRVLIDSSEDQNPESALTAWQRVMKRSNGRAAFCDLAWTHLTKWRSPLAQAFQPREMQAAFPTIDTVDILYSATRVPPHSGLSQSLLLVGWLAHALQWRPVRALQQVDTGTYTSKLRCGQQAINIHLAPTPPGVARAGGIESIMIHMTSGVQLELHTTDRLDALHVVKKKPGVPFEEGTVAAHEEPESELVSRELEVLQRDRIYEESIGTIVSLLTEQQRT